jgi:RHS repeat-associated protein
MKRSVSFAILAVLLARPLLAGDSMATYEITLTATGASSGVKAAARGVAAAYGGTVEPGAISEDRRTFVLRMKPESAGLMRGDPRIQSARPLQSRAHVSTILPPMDLGVYLYDGAGNIESIGNDQFRYDEAGRLKSATVNGSANQQTFTYDAFGNRKDAARAASASVCIGNTNCEMSAPVEATNTNHLTAATYDDAGNVTVLDGTYNYSYDALNMVKSTGGREYVYTADDERIATVSGGGWTWTIRSPGQQVLSELTSSGTNGASNWKWTRDHIWRGASLLAVEEKNASDVTVTRHFHLDHLGTPRLITNGTGQQIGLHAYYPFGTELLSSTTEAPPDNIKFTGHEWDDLGGDIHALTYMHARYYSGALGRFLSVDPTLDSSDLKKPQSWNRYAYVLNNPLNGTDPDGKCPQCAMGDYYKAKLAQQSMSPEEFEAYESARAEAVALATMIPDGIGLVSGIVGLGARLLAKEGAEVLFEAAGKREVLAALRSGAGELGDAQRATAIRSVQRATLKETVTVSKAADGTVQILKSRPGRDGAQTIVTTVLKDGTEKTVQTASNAAGKMIHYDPKNTKTIWDAIKSWWYQ